MRAASAFYCSPWNIVPPANKNSLATILAGFLHGLGSVLGIVLEFETKISISKKKRRKNTPLLQQGRGLGFSPRTKPDMPACLAMPNSLA